MTDQILELATFNIAPTSSDDDFLAASEIFQKEFLDQQPGFIRRDVIRKGEGVFFNVVLWRSQKDLEAVLVAAQSSPAAGQYFSNITFDPDAPMSGIEHHSLLQSYARG